MKYEDLELIVEWFAYIEQIANDRKTCNGVIMEDWAALDEIRCNAHNCQEYIKNHCVQPEPQGMDEAATKYAYDGEHENYGITFEESGGKVVRGLKKDAFVAGAEWDREQILKNAVEGVLVDNVDGTQEICLHGNRYGDKVRVIVLPKED